MKIRIGSRESKLAVIQAEIVMEAIRQFDSSIELELITMKTTGDKILDRNLDQIGGKGLFIKELERALLDHEVDLVVHSMKDMPMDVLPQLPILGVSRREDPRDVLVLPQRYAVGTEAQTDSGSRADAEVQTGSGMQTGTGPQHSCVDDVATMSLQELAEVIDFSKPIGCSSNRRMLQFAKLFPQAKFEPIRGNVQTRLRKLDSGAYGATIMAAAGLKRAGLENRISRYFSTEEMLPAACQGILAVQGRCGTDITFLKNFFDAKTWQEAMCERAFVRELDGGCTSPVAAFAVAAAETDGAAAVETDGAVAAETDGAAAAEMDDATAAAETDDATAAAETDDAENVSVACVEGGSVTGGRIRLVGLNIEADGKPFIEACEGSVADAERIGRELAEKMKR